MNKLIYFVIKRSMVAAVLWLSWVMAPAAAEPAAPAVSKANQSSASIQKQGIGVDMRIVPVAKKASVVEDDDVHVEFRIYDKATNNPVRGLHPAAWIDGTTDKTSSDDVCIKKISSFLTGTFGARPDFDLNVFYVLALNEAPTISVVDPLFNFGGSQLLAMVRLKSRGADWVYHEASRTVFVSMPKSNQVAVVDTDKWKVIGNVDVGNGPVRLGLQADQKYVWVATDDGISVIDTATRKLRTSFKTGSGRKEMAFSDDNRHAFVTDQQSGMLDIIHIPSMKKLKQLRVGEQPVSVAYSKTSQAVYISNAASGDVAVVDNEQLKLVSKIKAKPGLGMIRFLPHGRVALLLNTKKDVMHVIDPATNQIIKSGGVGKSPYQISFSETLAYIRSLENEIVLMVPFAGLEDPSKPVQVVDFSGGQGVIGKAGPAVPAQSIAMAPEGSAVLVANPSDRMIYYYSEGMAAPMGSFKNYGHIPHAVMVVDRSLQETSPGVYSTNFKFSKHGKFDVAFLLDSPRLTHCFEADVAFNKNKKRPLQLPVSIKTLTKKNHVKTGETVKISFQVRDAKSDKPKTDLKHVGVMASLVPGIWQQRLWARHQGDGVYSVEFKAPQDGLYYIFYKLPQYNINFNQLPYTILRAGKG